jgi:hypothetical protein
VVRSFVVSVVSIGLLLGGCEDRRDNEERLLLDRASRVDHDAPEPIRAQQIDDLATVVVQTEELVALRDGCVEGHRALLEAETEQARAGRELAVLSDGNPEAQIPIEKARSVEQAIRSSNDALARARELLRRCQEELSALRHRHG